MIRRIVLALVGVGILLWLLVYSQTRSQPRKVSGFIEADEIRLGSRVGGRVADVHVREGDYVAAGALLVSLEPFDLDAREQEARARLAERDAELARLTAGYRAQEVAQAKARVAESEAHLQLLINGPRPQEIEAARAEVQVGLAELELAQQTFARTKQLFERSAVPQDELDRATERLKAAHNLRVVREKQLELLLEGTRSEEIAQARAQLDEARQALELLEQGYRSEDIERARAARDAAQAALAAVQSQRGELEIKAPIPGVIEALELQTGDLVAADAPVLSLMDTRNLWVRAYVPGGWHVQLEQQVEVSVDGLPQQRFPGRVTFRSRQAEFTPGNVQTAEERAEQVFRIKVAIQDHDDQLAPGMTADVWFANPPLSPGGGRESFFGRWFSK
jgi:multidrug resistance efflux pump